MKRGSIEKIRGFLTQLSKRVQREPQIIADFISRERDLSILYTGYSRTIAETLYLVIKSLVPQRRVYIEEIERYSLYTAPYDEGIEQDLIIFSVGEDENNILRSIPPLVLTGHDLVLVTPRYYEKIPYGDRVSQIVVDTGGEHVIALLYVAIYSGLEYARRRSSSPRVSRLYREISSLEEVVEELYNRYRDSLEKIEDMFSSSVRIDVVSTPSARVFGDTIYRISRRRRGPDVLSIDYHELYRVREGSRVILLYTETEQHMVIDLRSRYLLSGGERPLEIYLRTDPLISPLYFAILARILEESL